MVDTTSGREGRISAAFVELADTLVDDYDVIDMLDRLVAYSVELLSADAAGILLADVQGNLRVVASSNEESEMIELLQLQADEGPCVECFRTGSTVAVPNLAEAGGRWPRFVTAAVDTSAFRAVHAVPLRLRGESLGGLNLFGREPDPMPEADLALGQALADIATIGILHERAIRRGEVLNEQLQLALNNRMVIEQAKGRLAQLGGLPVDAAFDRMRRYTRGRNLRLTDVARQVVENDLGPEVLAAPTTSRPSARRHQQ
ncbi:MAG: GAF and ANTAR domain-containing protein [Actinomycetia bacterium]|nr:GAF and ANTAR domain-containing protein [Actinomycetes bacterium]